MVSLLTLDELLNDHPGDRRDEHRNDVRLTINTTGQQTVQLLTSEHGRG